eukprot:12514766-Alexandrium_andersonii.AAC.1
MRRGAGASSGRSPVSASTPEGEASEASEDEPSLKSPASSFAPASGSACGRLARASTARAKATCPLRSVD